MSGLAIKKEVYRIIYWQLILIVGLALILFFIQGIQSSLSVLLGGLAYWLPTLLFVWCVFLRTRVRYAKQFLVSFVAGESIKLLLSATLFVLIIQHFPVHILSVLIGFVGAIVSFWIASLFLLTRQEGASS